MSKYQSPVSDRLRRRAASIQSWLCVGLDPMLDNLPGGLTRSEDGLVAFCSEVIAATEKSTVSFKINFGYFEALGATGWRALGRVRQQIPPGIPVVADAKRGDVATTAAAYARGVFDALGFDAVTLNPYLGWDSVQPWATYADRLLFILSKTSNAGSPHFQDLVTGGEELYVRVAREAREQVSAAEIGVVVGATYPESLRRVRELGEDTMILCPGVGAQGAIAEQAVAMGANRRAENLLVAVSRDILYASGGPDFADAAARAAALYASSSWRSGR